MSFRSSLLLLLLLFAAPFFGEQQKAEELLSAGRADEAIAQLKAEIQKSPGSAEAYHLLSRVYYGLQHWDDAIAYGERAVALGPGNSNYHMWLGRAYGQKAAASNFATAVKLTRQIRQEFERAVELDASNVSARTDLAEFYLEAPFFLGGGKSKALRQAETIAQRDQASAHWVSARVAEKEKRYDAAEQEYKAAIQASRDDAANYWLNLASFYRRRGRLGEMEGAVNQAMAVSQGKPDFLYDAASVLFEAGRNFPVAIRAIRQYLIHTVESAPAYQAHYLLGCILEKEGDRHGAAFEYRAALALAREFSPAQEALRRVGNQ